MRKLVALSIALVSFVTPTIASASNSHPSYALGSAKKCRVDYVKRTETRTVTERVKVKGKWVTERVPQRYVACVWDAPVVSVVAPITTTTLATTTTSSTTSTTTTIPGASPTALAVKLDPSYTQGNTPSTYLSVSYAFSASASQNGVQLQSLPNGVLEFYSDGLLTCSINVGAQVSSGQCPVTYASYGSHTVDTVYVSGTNSATTGSQSETIEPPAIQVSQTWGTSSPTTAPLVSGTIEGASGSFTVTDANWESPTGTVTLTDNLGNTCNLSITGTAGTCSMTVIGTPSTYTVAYPGGTSNQTTQAVSPNGTQPVTYTWGAQSVHVGSPSLTFQNAVVTWNGGTVRTSGSQTVQSWSGAPTGGFVNVPSGDKLTINAYAAGSLNNDQFPQGSIQYVLTPSGGATMVDGQPASSSASCSGSFNYSLQAVGVCQITFQTPGSYTLQVNYVSTDGNYESTTGPEITVNAS